jgi:hypothetical protein
MQNRTKFPPRNVGAVLPRRVDFAGAIFYKPPTLPPTVSLPLSAGLAVF